MQVKTVEGFEIKSEAKGQVEAVFATFNAVDKDNDVTLPGAFQDGARAPISQWGHNAIVRGVLPVGIGTIKAGQDEAVMAGQYNMDDPHGRSAFSAVVQLHEAGLGQWSYGYDPLEWHMGMWGSPEKQVRFLVRQQVNEFSPVVQGAGVGTRTVSAKDGLRALVAAGLSEDMIEALEMTAGEVFKAAIRPHSTQTTAGAWDASAVVGAIPADASVSDLRSVFAWVDSSADPENKSSYKFPHHTRVGGPAVARACIAGIAALNGARGGTSIPSGDRAGVYAHLAGHLRGANREPPELRSASGGTGKTALYDELVAFLAETDAMLEQVAAVAAVRTEAGKGLSVRNVEVLGWLDDSLRALRRLVDPAGFEDAEHEFLRYLQVTQRSTR